MGPYRWPSFNVHQANLAGETGCPVKRSGVLGASAVGGGSSGGDSTLLGSFTPTLPLNSINYIL